MRILILVSMCLVCAGIGLADQGGDVAPIDLTQPVYSPVTAPYLAFSAGDVDLDMRDVRKNPLGDDRQDRPEKVSMQKAMLLSILFPGAGQYYAGAKFRGQVFMGAELGIWAGFIAYRVYGDWKEDDFQAFATARAGLPPGDRSNEFYDWVGFYESRDEFNQLGLLFFPERSGLSDTPENYWQWESDTDRLHYKELVEDSKRAERNSNFLLALAFVNRVIAGIDTYRTVKAVNRQARSITEFGDYKLNIDSDVFSENPRVGISIARRF